MSYCDCDEYSAKRKGYYAGYEDDGRYTNPYKNDYRYGFCECENKDELERAWDNGYKNGEYEREYELEERRIAQKIREQQQLDYELNQQFWEEQQYYYDTQYNQW